MCGDFNVTPAPIDAYHYWEGTSETKSRSGFREDERDRMAALESAGWTDLVRESSPRERLFTRWSSPEFYEQNKGLRAHLVLGNPVAHERLRRAWIDRDYYDEPSTAGGPDHAPVTVEFA